MGTISGRQSPVIPLALWLAVQGLMLLLAALKIPFSNNFPNPAERMALDEMLVVQIAAAAILAPMLMRDATTAALAAIASWPFTMLAGLLAAEIDPWKIVCPAAVVSLWIAALALWIWILRTQRMRQALAALATSLALGGPLGWYLNAEFGGGNGVLDWSTHGRWGPIMAALGFCDGDPHNRASWEFLAGLVSITLATFFACRVYRKRPVRGRSEDAGFPGKT